MRAKPLPSKFLQILQPSVIPSVRGICFQMLKMSSNKQLKNSKVQVFLYTSRPNLRRAVRFLCNRQGVTRVPIEQWSLNTKYCSWYDITPFLLITNLMTFFMYLFIHFISLHISSIKCSSSGDRIILIHHLVWLVCASEAWYAGQEANAFLSWPAYQAVTYTD